MTDAKRAEHVTRDAILKLLSDEEIAKVSTAEAASILTKGVEYLDLEQRSSPRSMQAIGFSRVGTVTKRIRGGDRAADCGSRSTAYGDAELRPLV
jgi:hypothetical protein